MPEYFKIELDKPQKLLYSLYSLVWELFVIIVFKNSVSHISYWILLATVDQNKNIQWKTISNENALWMFVCF
jgi:hypothetical protein